MSGAICLSSSTISYLIALCNNVEVVVQCAEVYKQQGLMLGRDDHNDVFVADFLTLCT